VGILLTHGHFDHIMAVKEVKEKYQIPVYACMQEEVMLAEPTINMTAVYGSACSIKPDVLLDDGQIFEAAGFSIQMFHTPGHTKGSVCYLCNDYIFTGDTLFALSMGRTDFPGGNPSEMHKSLLRLAEIKEDLNVCPGHNETTTLSFEKRNNPYLKENPYEDLI
jgi:hydroxyacylglutathione hydrolase